MYDAVFVLVDAFTKLLKKKPDQFRAVSTKRGSGQTYNTSMMANGAANNVNGGGGANGGGSSGGGGTSNNNNRGGLDCNTSKGWVVPWEHGDKISRYLRKVSPL